MWLPLVLLCGLLSPACCFYPFQGSINNFFQLLGSPSNPQFPSQIQPRGYDTANYTYTVWSNYSECSVICGGGSRQKTRNCIDDSGRKVSLLKCLAGNPNRPRVSPLDFLRMIFTRNEYDTEVERDTCNSQECIVTEWGDWSSCDKPCGGGKQLTERLCLDSYFDSGSCNYQRHKVRNCNSIACFRTSPWSGWNVCSRECDTGRQARVRTCEPNLNSTDPQYQTLLRLLTELASVNALSIFAYSALNSGNPNSHYVNQYKVQCSDRTKRQQRSCNRHKCPGCPANQIYHHCKPCARWCERVEETFNIQQLLFNIFSVESLFSHLTGCNGVCETGCACPSSHPHRGSEYRCYRSNHFCPINQIPSGPLTPGLFGANFFSTPLSPRLLSHVTNVPVTEEYTTATIATTEPVTLTDPIEEGEEDEEPTLPPIGEGPDEGQMGPYPTRNPCPRDQLISTIPGEVPCDCDGEMVIVGCYKTADTSCPALCVDPKNRLLNSVR